VPAVARDERRRNPDQTLVFIGVRNSPQSEKRIDPLSCSEPQRAVIPMTRTRAFWCCTHPKGSHRRKGRWGGSMSMSAAAKKYRCRTCAGTHRSIAGKDDGVGDHHGARVEMPAAGKFSLQDLYPPSPPRNGTPTKGRWGWVNGDDHRGGRLDDIGELTHPHQEKFSLQDLYPPGRRGTGLR
jgi:hypothetical protein